ncbi:hypothetical protein CYMTET_47916 [Cymbomonas tetramitiformis]|uniref:Integrase catalytic domain-containing protein n=1 Tax=Cymbomonas tetramitiformis TaxID=36881 RepID=A0AAE0EW89_9CHLO|nr:hypothetical protein CYMTET_47916 [Cymbomonas tetramitiformis]
MYWLSLGRQLSAWWTEARSSRANLSSCAGWDCLIDRGVTSPDSPEGNGLTERVMRTIKFCFKKLALKKGLDYEWDEQLWPLVLSYNAARQESTGVAPFTLLFAQEVVVPPDLKRAPNWTSIWSIATPCIIKAEEVVAGGYEPKPHQFKVGDFVYIRQKPRSGMEVATKSAILKLVKIQRDGVVVLEDAAKLKEKSTYRAEYCTMSSAGTRMQAANAEVQTQETKVSCVLEDSRLGMKEQQLNEKLSPDMRLLPAEVGPRRVVKGSKSQPWQAISSREMMLEEKDLFLYMPDQVDWMGQARQAF